MSCNGLERRLAHLGRPLAQGVLHERKRCFLLDRDQRFEPSPIDDAPGKLEPRTHRLDDGATECRDDLVADALRELTVGVPERLHDGVDQPQIGDVSALERLGHLLHATGSFLHERVVQRVEILGVARRANLRDHRQRLVADHGRELGLRGAHLGGRHREREHVLRLLLRLRGARLSCRLGELSQHRGRLRTQLSDELLERLLVAFEPAVALGEMGPRDEEAFHVFRQLANGLSGHGLPHIPTRTWLFPTMRASGWPKMASSARPT